jgi:hypothetical protein
MLAVGTGDVCGTGGKAGAGTLGKDPGTVGVLMAAGGGGGGFCCFLLKSWQPMPQQNSSDTAASKHFFVNGIVGFISSSNPCGQSTSNIDARQQTD